ncbi:MAG TPA: 3-deoxy-7-phosphoheptulonate synthase, partial [Coxiellaceae bacterium]|nr:3-deoxy-7-phosphoheptulonate synthase [Coxiellaceae bacterium]
MLKIAHHTRQAIANILHGKDHRLVVIVGPCSIHNAQSALQYAKNLRKQIEKHHATLCIVMRTYVEKARSRGGWKGFVNDPDLNNTNDILKGLSQATLLLQEINTLGVPCAMEIVNPFTAHYFVPYLSWAAIGARTVESQIHREIASILPLPIGFKNTTGGDIQAAIDGAEIASQPHHFLGIDSTGKLSVQHSSGNPNTHIVLRGSK